MQPIMRRMKYTVNGAGFITGVISPDLSFWLQSKSEGYRSTPGFIYVLRNDLHAAHVYKVGRSERHPGARADELSRETSTPGYFELVDFRPTDDAALAEWLMFIRIAEFRIGPTKEFVFCDISIVIEALEEAAMGTCRCDSVNDRINYLIDSGRQFLKYRDGDAEL